MEFTNDQLNTLKRAIEFDKSGLTADEYRLALLGGDVSKSKVHPYLLKKDLFEEITHTEMDKQIVGEIPTRETIFLCAFGRLVENCQTASYNLLVTSSAGSGKDYVVSKVLGILPKEELVKKTRISPTVFTYWHNAKFEPDWTWDGKVFYTEDISEAILNCDVFKVMCSSGSTATIVIRQRAIDIDIKGKPVMIITTANSTPSPELTRRFEFCNLDEGINQTKEIMKRHSKYARAGITPVCDEEYSLALSQLKRVKVKVPFAELLPLHFPDKNIMMRTKFPRFLDLIKASCAFHQYQRELDEEGYYLAEEQDYEIAKRVIKKLTTNKYMIPLTINQQKIIKFFEEQTRIYSEKGRGEFKGSAQALLTQIGNIVTLKHFIINIDLLVSYGLLTSEIEQVGFKELEVYRLAEYLKEKKEFELPIFEDLKVMGELLL